MADLHEDWSIHFNTVDDEPVDYRGDLFQDNDDESEDRLEENVGYLDEDWGRLFDSNEELVDYGSGLFHEDYEDFAYPNGDVRTCIDVMLDRRFMAS